ncbi:MAG: S8 family serine peptidase, partial [Thermoplasmata archaeon]|nr:S8 family serine peptidase [Thermoplasmata archaeon]
SRFATDEYVVQFAGPIKREWLEEIEEMGGRSYGYFRFYSVLVKIPASLISAVKELPFVSWVGTYHPAYKISEGLKDAEGTRFMAVLGYDDADAFELALGMDEMGATVHSTSSNPPIVLINAQASMIPDIAALPDVMSVYPEGMSQTMDSVAGKIHKYHYAWYQDRSGLPTTLTGTGEVAGVLDSGFDVNDANDGHLDFFDSPNGDRVLQYYPATSWSANYFDGWGARCEPHGTACAGIILSDGYAWETSLYEGVKDTTEKEWHESEAGVAPEALLTTVGASGDQGQGIAGWVAYQDLPACNNDGCWDTMYLDDGAKTLSNSWGGGFGYGMYSNQVDTRIEKWNDLNILFAAGNAGPSSDSISDSIGKNGLTVGASQNYRPDYFGAD